MADFILLKSWSRMTKMSFLPGYQYKLNLSREEKSSALLYYDVASKIS